MELENSSNTVLGKIKIYDKNAKGYDNNCDVQYAHGKELIKIAVAKACHIVLKKGLKKLRVLDAGCGNGRTTINLYIELRKALISICSHIDISVVGMDISKGILELAKVNAEIEGITSGRVKFANRSVEDLSDEDGSFDMIFSNFALHLCTPNVYRRFFERLNTGGMLIFNIGGKNNCSNLYEMALKVAKEKEFSKYFENFTLPVFYPTKEKMNEIMHEAGFTDIIINEHEYNDMNYEKMIQTFIHASMLLFLEQLPKYELKELFKEKYYELSKKEDKKYKHVHRLLITAEKS